MPYLALEVYSISLLPHVSLDGVTRENRLGEASFDGPYSTHIITTVLSQDVSSGDTVGAETMEDGLFEACRESSS